ncbi:MAG: hypothetical protein Q9226_002093 [Calogaya cf. arnoldii]
MHTSRTKVQARADSRSETRIDSKGRTRCGCPAGDFDTIPPRVGVQNLLRRPWFKRVWVLQKVAAAKNVVVVCGDRSVDGDDFYGEIIAVASSHSSLGDILRTPDYSISPYELARRLVHFHLPESALQPFDSSGNRVVFEIEGLLLGKITGGVTSTGEADLALDTGETHLPGMEPNSFTVEILGVPDETFGSKWQIWTVNDRSQEEDTFAVLLRGSTRPTALRLHQGKYVVDMLATPEPILDTCHSPSSARVQSWSEAHGVFAANPTSFQKIKLHWDPYQHAHKPDDNGVPSIENLMRHYELMQKNLRDIAEVDGINDHNCLTDAMLWNALYADKDNLIAGTSRLILNLYDAAYHGYFGTLDFLLDTGVDMDRPQDKTGCMALHVAAPRGHTTIVSRLLNARANVNPTSLTGTTPLWSLAAVGGYFEICELLLSAGERIWMHASLFCSLGGHSTICQLLLGHGVNPNTPDHRGLPLLFKPIYDGHFDIMRVLLNAGANVNAVSDTQPPVGLTALHLAAKTGSVEIVKLLHEANAEMDTRNSTGHTPLHQAALTGCQDTIKLLLEYNTDVNSQAGNGEHR